MIDLLIKLLIVMFTVFVGGCFVLWPEEVARRFDKWRGGSVESAKGRWSDVRKYAVVTSLRQIGGFLFVLACYVFYLEWLAK